MNISKIEYTPKLRAIARDEHKILTLYGATGNGKSMLMSLKGLSRIFRSPSWQRTFILAGRDIGTIERRFTESQHSVLNWYPFRGRWEYKKHNAPGGSQILIPTETGEKQLFLTPFNNRDSWGRILGLNPDGFMVDEFLEGDELFIQEVVNRTIRQKHTWSIFTSNGGDPSHYGYSGIIDRSMTIDDFEWEEFVTDNQLAAGVAAKGRVVVRGTPKEELEYQLAERDSFKMFFHLSLEDNPTYSEEQLKALYGEYPVGSYMWYSRILGIRGFSESSPFSSYLTPDIFVGVGDSVKNVRVVVFSVDVGGHVFSDRIMPGSLYKDGDFGTEKGGHTVKVAVGFDRYYKNVYLLGVYFPNRMIQSENADLISKDIYEYVKTYPMASRPYMFSDPADSSMLATLRSRVRNVREVRGAIKVDRRINLDEVAVVTLLQQFFMRKRIKIVDNESNRKWLVPALRSARQDSNGKLIDNESWESDVLDALKYVFSSMYRILVERSV